MPVEGLARRARADGFAALQFDPVLHGVAAEGPAAAGAARRALEAQGLTVAALAGYTNRVDPDPERRARGNWPHKRSEAKGCEQRNGRMEWAAYADLLRRHAPTIPLLLEHLRPEQVAECRAFVERAFAAGA